MLSDLRRAITNPIISNLQNFGSKEPLEIKTGYLYSGNYKCHLFCSALPVLAIHMLLIIIPDTEVDSGLSWPKLQYNAVTWLLVRHQHTAPTRGVLLSNSA